VSDTVCC